MARQGNWKTRLGVWSRRPAVMLAFVFWCAGGSRKLPFTLRILRLRCRPVLQEEVAMPVNRKRDALVLDQGEIERLQTIQSSGKESPWSVVRAGILLRYARGEAISEIARQEGVSRPTVQHCLDKALSGGIETAIRDLSRTGRPSMVTAEDKAWVMHLACSRPREHGYESEEWTLSQLTSHVRKHATETDHLSSRCSEIHYSYDNKGVGR